MQGVLGYAQWRRFSEAVERAKIACETSGFNISDHFADVGKMVSIGSGAERNIVPEDLPPAEEIKKVERRVISGEKKLATEAGKLPQDE